MIDPNDVVSRQTALTDMLSSPDKWVPRSKNFLTLMVRKVMYDIHLVPRQYFAYIERWLQRKYGVSKETATKIATNRNNFISEITKDEITAGTFMKFTESLGAAKITINLTLEFDDGREDINSTITFTNALGEQTEDVEKKVQERMDKMNLD